MSELDEKLAPPPPPLKHGPRRSLESLEKSWAFEATKTEGENVVVWMTNMDAKRECWIRVSGKGKTAIFELVGEGSEGSEK